VGPETEEGMKKVGEQPVNRKHLLVLPNGLKITNKGDFQYDSVKERQRHI
jgi:hypothetical protein